METTDEIGRIKELQKEVQQLKDLLLKKDLDNLMLDSYLEVAAENMGYKSLDDLKKNFKHQALMRAVGKSLVLNASN
ncbi:hypothetical protein [Reichenbachiella sp. 5M10]|uniref:hypothetical protein n=1 Tax=Reichenbachiella sp. 5M10 TaxID=1889772 RepID=UPI00117AB931|nr:hypothetical protein [Reichenbachiella sp. 5M10]